MDTSAIQSATNVTQAKSSNAMSGMSSEDFLNLLVNELQNQDPFEPQQTSDMISQVSQIRDLEVSGSLTESLSLIASNQKNLGSADLIGKYVQGSIKYDDGTEAALDGVVTGVTFSRDGEVVLELDTGMSLTASDLTRVTTVEEAELEAQAASDAEKTLNGKAKTTDPATEPKPWFKLDASIEF